MSGSSAAQRGRIRSLEGKRAKLAREAAGLIREQQQLLLRNAILNAWCEALTLLQLWMACETSASEDSQQAEGVRERFRELLNHEVRLLDELTVRDSIASCSVSEAAAVLPDPGPDAISPGDPMQYFRAVSVLAYHRALCDASEVGAACMQVRPAGTFSPVMQLLAAWFWLAL
jgi:hypothetical protein